MHAAVKSQSALRSWAKAVPQAGPSPRPCIKPHAAHSSMPAGKSKPWLPAALVRALLLPAEGTRTRLEVCPALLPPQPRADGLRRRRNASCRARHRENLQRLWPSALDRTARLPRPRAPPCPRASPRMGSDAGVAGVVPPGSVQHEEFWSPPRCALAGDSEPQAPRKRLRRLV